MTRPVKVLYIDSSLGFGGAIKSLCLTLSRLPGVERFVLTSQEPESVRRWLEDVPVWSFRRLVNYRTAGRVREWLEARVRVRLVRWLALKAMALADLSVALKNTLRIVLLVRRRGIHLIHLNNGFGPAEALFASRLTGVPCVVHLRDFYRGQFPIGSLVDRQVARVIAVSDAVAASLSGTRIDARRVTTVHDPVDLEAIDRGASARERIRRECGISESEVAVGIFGRVVPWKGQLEFVEALVRAMREEPSVRAMIVGDGSDGGPGYLGRVRERIERSGLADRFVLTGYRESVEEYYAAVDVVVHASVTPEPFGMVVPEGMAARRPVIASDAGGPREVITHGSDGLLVPAGDPAALAAAIRTLCRDPSLRARTGHRAREVALARFGVEANGATIRRVYDDLLEDAESRGSRWPARRGVPVEVA